MDVNELQINERNRINFRKCTKKVNIFSMKAEISHLNNSWSMVGFFLGNRAKPKMFTKNDKKKPEQCDISALLETKTEIADEKKRTQRETETRNVTCEIVDLP